LSHSEADRADCAGDQAVLKELLITAVVVVMLVRLERH
jgi:hypothetical protein